MCEMPISIAEDFYGKDNLGDQGDAEDEVERSLYDAHSITVGNEECDSDEAPSSDN